MRKEERLQRRERQRNDIAQYELEDEAMQNLFSACRPILTNEEWTAFYDSMWQNGKWFYAFNCVMRTLAYRRTPITPKLRKLIDICLETFDVPREKVSELPDLNYDEYWRRKYGYESKPNS